jgi:hypothetical protein
MTSFLPRGASEDELDILVSIAIHRAELLDEMKSPMAATAWHEVMTYEELLARATTPSDITGGVARAGAVMAAFAAGRRSDARRLAAQYLAEEALPAERRSVIARAMEEDATRLAATYPALTKQGRISRIDELGPWRLSVRAAPHMFPCPV